LGYIVDGTASEGGVRLSWRDRSGGSRRSGKQSGAEGDGRELGGRAEVDGAGGLAGACWARRPCAGVTKGGEGGSNEVEAVGGLAWGRDGERRLGAK